MPVGTIHASMGDVEIRLDVTHSSRYVPLIVQQLCLLPPSRPPGL